MTNGPTADASLVAGAIDGDETALEAIYRKYRGAVKLVARKVLRDDALAGEIAGFTLTREVAGGVVSSEGDVVSVIADL